MIFSSPFNVVFGIFMTFFIGVILALYQIDITNPSNTNKHLGSLVGVITLSTTTILLFIVFTIFSGITAYRIWADDKKIEGYLNLLEFSKIFTFRIPL